MLGWSLRSLLIAAGLLVATCGVHADSVTLKFADVYQFDGTTAGTGVSFSTDSGAHWTGTTAGQFLWTKQSGDSFGVFASGNKAAKTFCIEVNEHISSGGTYTYNFHDLPGLPQDSYGAGMSVAKASFLQKMADMIGRGLFTLHTYTAPEFQAAIWNTVFDGDLLIESGVFRLTGLSNTRVDDLLSEVNGYTTYDPNTAQYNFIGLTNNIDQDQIALVTHAQYLQELPVPAGVVLAGMGIACIGGINFLRRRKAISN